MDANVSELLGKTITEIKGGVGDDRMEIKTSDGCFYVFYHSQDCCESCDIEDIAGDIQDLIGEPLLMAEEVESRENPADYKPGEYGQDSFTWTFYKLATRKGGVTIRWYGESNGYYSESVDFICMLRPENGSLAASGTKP